MHFTKYQNSLKRENVFHDFFTILKKREHSLQIPVDRLISQLREFVTAKSSLDLKFVLC